MHTHVCLLRAVNVGGTGKLPMADLRAMCEAAGFVDVRTYIASGNVVLRSASTAKEVQAMLEAILAEYAGKPVGVLVRSPAEMSRCLPTIRSRTSNRLVVIFLDTAPPHDALGTVSGVQGEASARSARARSTCTMARPWSTRS